MNKFFKSHIDTIYEDLEHLESKVNPNNDEDDELEEHSEEIYKDAEDKVEESAQRFIKMSLKVLDEMEEDVKMCRKNGQNVKEKH